MAQKNTFDSHQGEVILERVKAQTLNWKLLAVLPLLSGAALLVYIATAISLGLLLVAACVFITLLWGITWRTLSPLARTEVTRRAIVGVVAGIVATMVYDLSRWIAVTVFHYNILALRYL